MPVYNTEKYLNAAIDSILNQTYHNFELIIIDDCSTDNSPRIINEYKDSRIIRIRNDKNLGLVKTLNKAISMAKGNYIARMDSDDVSHNLRFEKQMCFIKSQEADLCGCHYHIINEFGTITESVLVPIKKELMPFFLVTTVPFAHGSVLMKRECFTNKNLEYRSGKNIEDHDLWVSLYEENYKIVNINEYLFSYRSYSQSLSRNKVKKMRREGYFLSKRFVLRNIDKLNSLISKINLKEISERDKIHYFSSLILMALHTKNGKYLIELKKAERSYLKKAILTVFKCFLIPRFL